MGKIPVSCLVTLTLLMASCITSIDWHDDYGKYEMGLVPIFNKTDLSGWTGDKRGYMAKDGMLVADAPKDNLYTIAEYDNFVAGSEM